MASCICGADVPCMFKCLKHDRVLHGYPCGECEREWEESHPLTAAAISMMADPKVSLSKAQRAFRAAKKKEPT